MIPRQASAPGHVALPAARQTGALAAKLPDLPLQADFDAVICVLRGDAHTGNELAQAMRSLGLDAAEPAAQQAALAWVFDRIVDEAPLLDPPLLGELVRALGSALGGPGMTEAEIDSFFLQLASCAPQLSSQQLSDAVAAFGLALDIAHVDASRERLFQQVAGLAATAPLASVTAWAS
ncbi:MAG TPA: hypothetical protein VLJ86_11855, partial [Ramlibacter sp.]|nr:hypothetical protein [Ramlibacter sp.]